MQEVPQNFSTKVPKFLLKFDHELQVKYNVQFLKRRLYESFNTILYGHVNTFIRNSIMMP